MKLAAQMAPVVIVCTSTADRFRRLLSLSLSLSLSLAWPAAMHEHGGMASGRTCQDLSCRQAGSYF